MFKLNIIIIIIIIKIIYMSYRGAENTIKLHVVYLKSYYTQVNRKVVFNQVRPVQITRSRYYYHQCYVNIYTYTSDEFTEYVYDFPFLTCPQAPQGHNYILSNIHNNIINNNIIIFLYIAVDQYNKTLLRIMIDSYPLLCVIFTRSHTRTRDRVFESRIGGIKFRKLR